ncbi:heparinase II/III family protein [Kribbella sp. NPDC054772]
MTVSRRTLLAGAALSLASGALTSWRPRPASAATVPPLADGAFFGVWSAAEQRWTTAPQLNYADYPLADVAAAAKAGRYDDAATALLKYYRNRPARTTAGYSTNGFYPTKRLPLIADNIWSLGKGELYHSTLTLDTASTTVTVDVSDLVTADLATGSIGFLLMARTKSSAIATIASRHAAAGAPTLRVTTDAGAIDVPAAASTYIAAGAGAGTAHGAETQLVVADSGTGPYRDATRKAYLSFDLRAVTGTPKSAELRLTGSSTIAGTGVMVFEDKETFDETTRTWNNTIQNTLSYQGDPGGFDWTWPAHTDKEWYYQLPRFYWAGPMADAYASTHDEALAQTMIRQIRDFIADADATTSPAGAGSYPRNLDAGIRSQHWVYAYEVLRTSPSLDAATNTAVLKTLVRGQEFLRTSTSDTPNHVFSFMAALIYVAGYFPELAGSAGWIADAQRVLGEQLAASLYPDGGYREATYSYTYVTMGTFLAVGNFCKANGIAFTPGADLRRAAWYAADGLYPDGTGPNYGDSSNDNFTGSLKSLADYFDDDQLRYVAALGTSGTAPDHSSVVYPDTRVIVQRTGWTRDASYLRMNLDRGPHQHPDELALQLYVHDRPLLPAMGAFTYSDDAKSNWLRLTTQANTTVTIDGAVQDPTAAGAIDTPLDGSWATVSTGWTEATPGVRHTRTVVRIGGRSDGFWIVSDALDPADSKVHDYEQNWHLLPDAMPVLGADGSTRTAFASGTNLVIAPLIKDGLRSEIKDGYYSARFYEVQPTKYASYTLRTGGPVRLATLLLPVLPGLPRSATATAVTADPRLLRLDLTGKTAFIWLGSATSTTGSTFDASFGYVENAAGLTRVLADQWTKVGTTGRAVLSADRRLGPTAVLLDRPNRTVTVETAEAPGATLAIDAPWAQTVTLNGTPRTPRRTAAHLELPLH